MWSIRSPTSADRVSSERRRGTARITRRPHTCPGTARTAQARRRTAGARRPVSLRARSGRGGNSRRRLPTGGRQQVSTCLGAPAARAGGPAARTPSGGRIEAYNHAAPPVGRTSRCQRGAPVRGSPCGRAASWPFRPCSPLHAPPTLPSADCTRADDPRTCPLLLPALRNRPAGCRPGFWESAAWARQRPHTSTQHRLRPARTRAPPAPGRCGSHLCPRHRRAVPARPVAVPLPPRTVHRGTRACFVQSDARIVQEPTRTRFAYSVAQGTGTTG